MGKNKYDIIIAIDPDNKRDGIAILNPKTRHIRVMETQFGKTLSTIEEETKRAQEANLNVITLIEGGWLNKGNYHLCPYDSKNVAAAKGVNQGMNHQRGKDIEEYCQYHNIPHQIVKPLTKCWGKKGNEKISQAEIESFMGKLRTTDKNGRKCMPNQEGRDAALIAWVWGGLAIHVPISAVLNMSKPKKLPKTCKNAIKTRKMKEKMHENPIN